MIPLLRHSYNPLKVSSCHHHLIRFSTSVGEESVVLSSVYEFLVQRHHFPPKSASQIASAVSHLRNPEKSDALLSFLKQNGFSDSQLEQTVKGYPALLNVCLESTVKSKLKAFQDFGLSSSDVAVVLSASPRLFRASVNRNIVPGLSLLTNLLGSVGDSTKLLKFLGLLLTSNLNNTLVPNIEHLKNCGVSMDQIVLFIRQFPRFLLFNPEHLKKIVDNVDAMGVKRSSKNFLCAVRLMTSYTLENWELKMRTLLEVGFSDDDVRAAFRKGPLVFGLSEETFKAKIRMIQDQLGLSDSDIVFVFRCAPNIFGLTEDRIKEAKEVLMANGKYNLSCIRNCPISLMCSIKNRLQPRMQVLELLESNNLIQSWPPFSTFILMSNRKFYEKYVAPFLDEMGDVYTVKKKKN